MLRSLVPLLSLLVGAAGQQIGEQGAAAPARDPNRLSAQEMMDDITEFDPFADQLQCSGCKLVSKAMQSGLDSKFSKVFKKLKKAERLTGTKEALEKGCATSPDLPERFLRMGSGRPNSTKEFLDAGEQFRLLPDGKFANKKAFDHAVLEIEDAPRLKRVCNKMATELTKDYATIVQKLAARSRKNSLTSFNVTVAVCYQQYKLCKLGPDEEFDEDDEEDDDREL